MTTKPLRARIADLIAETGPIPVSVYMQLCLHDRTHGYYATGGGLGRDFTTAPETSQVFGELIGLWCAHEWSAMGRPAPFNLIELGPGRGVMMADALRATRGVTGFHNAARLTLIEASPTLRRDQQKRVAASLDFADRLEDAPDGPALIVANEFLDCLPIRQFVRDGDHWRERVVGLDGEGLAFGLTDRLPAPDDAPRNVDAYEARPAADALIDALARRFSTHPGRALFVDYGPAAKPPDDTLRAYKNGVQVSPLDQPGDADLTSDVDFCALRSSAAAAGMSVHGPTPQGRFLAALGAEARAQALMSANPTRSDAIASGVRRLLDPADMGVRFQGMAISSPGLPAPAGFEEEDTSP